MSSSNIPVFVMTVGLPGSGKTTFAYKLAPEIDAEVLSSDDIRIELFGDIRHQSDNDDVFRELHKRVKSCLRAGKSCIYDATNVSSKRRMAFLREINDIVCVKVCVIVATRYETCLDAISKRQSNADPSVCNDIPENVVKRMRSTWNTPHKFEGWDIVHVFYPYGEDGTYNNNDWIIRSASYDQCNPHHTSTLGDHCVNVYKKLIDDNWNDQALCAAGLIHDIGKEHTQTFINAKGEKTDIAHYYNHENVGAYESLFYQCNVADMLDVSILVNLHMRPYSWEKSSNAKKLQDKHKNLWGDKLFDQVMCLHNADKMAH